MKIEPIVAEKAEGEVIEEHEVPKMSIGIPWSVSLDANTSITASFFVSNNQAFADLDRRCT